MTNLITTPVARLVMGSLYEPNTKKMDGSPLIDEKTGQPTQEYWFHVAIPKGQEQHWNQTQWGSQIWQFVNQEFANKVPPNFVWKIDDGDSTIPNTKGRIPRDNEGYAGCWILKLKSRYAPNIYDQHNKLLTQEGFIQTGNYIQARVNLAVNRGTKGVPSLLANATMVGFNSYGAPIISARIEDPNDVGFGAPPVGSVTPLASEAFNNMVTQQAPVPQAIQTPSVPVVPTVPHTGILTPPIRRMTPKAQGATYEQLLQAGWTDELLTSNGLMII